MPTTDPRVDAYIAASAPFARPILAHLRAVVHAAVPEVEETMKWSFPHFVHQGILCSMASFKAHCAFGFWMGALIVEGDADRSAEAMGQLGRITSIDDLPPKRTLTAWIRRAKELNEQGVKVAGARKPSRSTVEPAVPDAFAKALRGNARARAAFDAFPPSHRREYIQWIAEAKRDETRERRITQALEWIAEGKQRNWKYQR